MKTRRPRWSACFALLLLFLIPFESSARTGTRAPKPDLSCIDLVKRANPGKIRVGELNFENIFDFANDLTKFDDELLADSNRTIRSRRVGEPVDWNREKLKIKLAQIYRQVKYMGFPDVLAGIELENEIVAGLVARVLGYDRFLMTRSPDGRNANVALFFSESKGFELSFHNQIELTGEEFAQYPTRNILEVGFRVNGKLLVFYVNHWPSQRGPASCRWRAAEILLDRIRQLYRRYPEARVLALGDFNVIDAETEKPHAFKDMLVRSKEDHHLYDIHAQFLKSPKVTKRAKAALPPGTYFYDKTGEWNWLDRFFVSKNLLASRGMRVDLPSFKVHTPRFAMQWYQPKDGSERFLIPWGYDHSATNAAEAGFTDHLGSTVDIKVE